MAGAGLGLRDDEAWSEDAVDGAWTDDEVPAADDEIGTVGGEGDFESGDVGVKLESLMSDEMDAASDDVDEDEKDCWMFGCE